MKGFLGDKKSGTGSRPLVFEGWGSLIVPLKPKRVPFLGSRSRLTMPSVLCSKPVLTSEKHEDAKARLLLASDFWHYLICCYIIYPIESVLQHDSQIDWSNLAFDNWRHTCRRIRTVSGGSVFGTSSTLTPSIEMWSKSWRLWTWLKHTSNGRV